MTKEEFAEMQLQKQRSGMPLKMYLQHAGISYSTYNYWRKKYQQEETSHDRAPITIRQEPASDRAFTGQMHGGATLLFPNGLRVHLGSGTEGVLAELLNKSLSDHVLP